MVNHPYPSLITEFSVTSKEGFSQFLSNVPLFFKEGDLGGDLELKWDPGVRNPLPTHTTSQKKKQTHFIPKSVKSLIKNHFQLKLGIKKFLNSFTFKKMNKTNFKLFTMFLAGIAFSAMTVLAATISISTNFEDGVTQYLKKLVILKNDNTTWMVLDWDTLSGEDIYGTNITWTNIHWSSIYGNTLSGTNIYWTNISWNNIHWSSIHGNTLSGNNIKSANITGTNIYWTNISGNNITWTNIKGNKISGQSWLFFQYCDQSWQSCKTITQLSPNWIKNNNNNIYYNDGNVWIWTANPSEKLEVNGTGKFSGNISAKNGYFSGMEIKGSDVKLLSTVFQKEFTWNYQNSWLYLPKWTTSWTQNDALATDSKRYISCNNFWTWIILLSLYKQWNIPFFWLQTYPFTKTFYAMLSFENTAFYELKAWESFSVNSTCSSWLIVSKQEYWWNTTSRE